MGLFSKYFTQEGKIQRLEQSLRANIAADRGMEVRTVFEDLLLRLVKAEKGQALGEMIKAYLPEVVRLQAVPRSIGSPQLQTAVALLNQVKADEAATLFCKEFGLHEAFIDQMARKARYNEIFGYLSTRGLLDKEMLGLLIGRWEHYNGTIRGTDSIATLLKAVAMENSSVLPPRAHIHEAVEAYPAAGRLYESESQWEKAARCYELAKQPELALPLYQKVKDAESISRVAEQMGDLELALTHVVKPERKFQLLLATGRLQEADVFAVGFENMQHYRAMVRQKANEWIDRKMAALDHASALAYFPLSGRAVSEMEAVLQAGRTHLLRLQFAAASAEQREEIVRMRIRLEAQAGEYEAAAEIAREELQDTALAIDYYEQARQFHKAIHLAQDQAGRSSEAKSRLAELHRQGGNLHKAAALYEELGDHAAAYELYLELGNPKKALEAYQQWPQRDARVMADLCRAAGDQRGLIDCLITIGDLAALNDALDIATRLHATNKVNEIQQLLHQKQTFRQEDLEVHCAAALKYVLSQYCPVLGIDYGTSTSVCALYNRSSKQPEVVTNAKGQAYEPSYFGLSPQGESVFGDQAKTLRLTRPDLVVSAVKRSLGGSGTISVGNHSYSTEEVVASQLAHLCDNVNSYLGAKMNAQLKEMLKKKGMMVPDDVLDAATADYLRKHPLDAVKEVVLTVPAYFNDSQKNATKDAAEIAGLRVRRLLHEPTAAALAFGRQRTFVGRLAVLDLGGGTYDISILEVGEGLYDVEAVGGDPKLGGGDIDQRLFLHFVKQIQQQDNVNLHESRYTLEAARLRDACESLKILLSYQEEALVELPFFLNQPKRVLRYSRAELRKLCQGFLDKFEKALRDALSLVAEPVHHFILVGNATKMPAIEDISATVLGAKPIKGIDPGLVVAMGAAIDGAILAGDIQEALILDVVPFSLGVAVKDRDNPNTIRIDHLIERNTHIPVTKTKDYTTTEDNQDLVSIKIYQGESDNPDQNHCLGRFDLTGLLPRKAGELDIKVTFDISADCILTVTAEEATSRKRQSIKINESVRLSYSQKQALMNRFKEKSSLQHLHAEQQRLMADLESLVTQFKEHQSLAAKMLGRFKTLFAEKLDRNAAKFTAQQGQLPVIAEIFAEKDELEFDLVKYNDRASTLQANSAELTRIHLDFSDVESRDRITTHLANLQKLVDAHRQMNQRYGDGVVRKLYGWVNVLDEIPPNIETMGPIERARHLASLGRTEEAMAILASGVDPDDRGQVEMALECYLLAQDIYRYKSMVLAHSDLLGHRVPKLDDLAAYLPGLANSVFLIQVDFPDGSVRSGTAVGLREHQLLTSRQLIEGGNGIRLSGGDRLLHPHMVVFDPEYDLAFLHVTETITPMRIGASAFIEPGETVLSIDCDHLRMGQAIGISGVVTGLRNEAQSRARMVFTDHSKRPHGLGAPLINDIGEVIGIFTETGSGKDSIALPIHLANRCLNQTAPV